MVRAPGKVNISLLVKGKREDGFHDIETVMAKIDWYDEILIERQKAKGSRQNIELVCKGEYKVPEGEENLVYRAAEEILKIKNKKVRSEMDSCFRRNDKSKIRTGEESTGWKPVPRVKITLTKNMPAGSGLGSGSSDAAATLMGINKFLKLGLDKKELTELAAKLGSDAAFFVDGPTALCTGRGEKVKKLRRCEFRAFLIVPDISVSTKRVYENYRHREGQYLRLRGEINTFIEKKRIDLIGGLCANMLEESCYELHPELGMLKKRIEKFGVGPVCLSGSGSSMYCIINDRNEEAITAYRDKLEQEFGCRVFIVNNNSW